MVEKADGIEIVAASLTAAPRTVHATSSTLSTLERQRASRFVFERDRRRFIMRRALLRRLLGRRLGVSPSSIELAAGAHGKPALAGPLAESDLRFNLSHCGDLAVYAFAPGRDVGIDVEAIRAVEGADSMAATAFSRRENAVYRALPSRDRPLGFLNCWTRKEAFVKAIGLGLSHPLDSFDVSLAPGEPARILRVGNTDGEDCGWRLQGLVPAPGFVAAVVSSGAS